MQQLFDPTSSLGQTLFRLCLSVPWERFLVKAKVSPEASEVVVRAITPPKPRPVLASSMIAAAPAPALPAAPPAAQAPVPAPVQATATPAPAPRHAIAKPGCTAADEAAVALFHLDGLARGKGGFGVLRVSKERLEKAADAAAYLKRPEVAEEMRAIAAELPSVHTPEAALALKNRLEPVVYDKTWDLGRSCKGALSESDLAEIKALAAKIAARQKE